MIVGVRDVYYHVQDMQRAIAFYRDVLGLKVVYGSDDWTTLKIGDVHIGLESTEGKPVPKVEGWPYSGATLTLQTTDIRADLATLRAKGVKFLGEIGTYEWGHVVSFEDSEGNILKLLQEPG